MSASNETQKLEKLFPNKSGLLSSHIPILIQNKLFYSRLMILSQQTDGRKTLQELGINIGDAIDILDVIKNSDSEEINKKDNIVTRIKSKTHFYFNVN